MAEGWSKRTQKLISEAHNKGVKQAKKKLSLMTKKPDWNKIYRKRKYNRS